MTAASASGKGRDLSMAAVALGMLAPCLDDSIFSLLDQYWYSQSILSVSRACVPLKENTSFCLQPEKDTRSEVESETLLRADFGADFKNGFASCLAKYSSLEVIDEDIYPNDDSTEIERCNSIDALEMRRVFDRFDSDADGLISGDELRRYMSAWRIDMSDAEVCSMIKSVDLNNDGGVDFEEFFSLYQTVTAGEGDKIADYEDHDDALLEAFRVFDRNQDGFISAQELQAVFRNVGMPEGKSLKSCQNMIHNVDRNGDGRCDVHEFQKMMSTKPF